MRVKNTIINVDFTCLKQFVTSILAIVALIGALDVLAVFLKAVNSPWWGIGYLIGLALLTPFVYIVAQAVSSSVNVSLPECVTNIVDATSEINLVSIGVVVGFVVLIIIVIYKLMEDMYSY